MDSTYHHPEGIDPPDHQSYEIYPGSSSSSFSSNRYRTNASSSSSLGPNYNMSSENLYSHPSYSDSVPSFGPSNGNPYDMITSLPSSYGSGKVSPMTPTDPAGGLHHLSPYPSGGKEFSQGFPDIPDRRLPPSTGYTSDLMDDYSIPPGMNGTSQFPPPPLQQYSDRMGRFPPDNRFHPPGHPPTPPSHALSGPGSDILRGIPPHATHSFRESGVQGYEEMPHFLSPTPHSDLSLRGPAIDDPMGRIKLQGHPVMGASTDLQTFIR